MTNQEVVERALKFIHNPNWEFEESLILYMAVELALILPSIEARSE